jgi:ABC-type multidrug transport system fused ATPase/permease subunit
MPLKKVRRRQALERQIARLERSVARLDRLSNRLIWLRLLLFVAGFLLTGALFFTSGPRSTLLALPFWFIPFLALVFYHRRIQNARHRHRLYCRRKQEHRARMALDWDQLPPPRFTQAPAGHPFALDLDLPGLYGLHRLLDATTTAAGSRILVEWLLATRPDPAETERRQQLVQELAPAILFRDRLHLAGRLAQEETEVLGGDPEAQSEERLEKWLQRPATPALNRPGWLVVLILLGAAAAGLLLLNLSVGGPALWLIPFAVYALLYLSLYRQGGDVFGQLLEARSGFEQLQAVLRYLESFHAPTGSLWQELLTPLTAGETCPSTQVRRLNWLSAGVGLAQNWVFGFVLNLFFPWNFFFAYRLERMRHRLQDLVPGWLAVWHELEALSALAGFHYLNPQYAVPRLHHTPDAAPFTGRDIGHPLLPDAQKIGNDFTFAHRGDLAIITGSNMAGKSTFLRALGVNLVLAYAGGPVDAAALTTAYFRLFTSIRVTDSVTDGISYFYAEVQRLTALLAAVQDDQPYPLFFLIDEIFRGTNNRERLIGSQAFVRELAGQNSVGAIATHDLELVQLADDRPDIHNVHFRDAIADGRMVFDYTLRPGPCPTTNALQIMRAAGLPVEG